MVCSPFLPGVAVATAVSFAAAMPFVKKFVEQDGADDSKLDEAKSASKSLKGTGKITNIAFACDAGMGSSAMGANKLTKLLKAQNMDVKVEHSSVDEIPAGAQIVIAYRDMMERVKLSGTKAQCVTVINLVNAPEYADVVQMVVERHKEILKPGIPECRSGRFPQVHQEGSDGYLPGKRLSGY